VRESDDTREQGAERAPEKDRQNPWAWRPGHNPYRHTAFQILDLEPDLAGRAAIKARVRKRRQRITRGAERFPVHGKVIGVADVNAAEEEIADPATRLLAELLTHRPEAPGPDPAELAEEFADLEPPDPPAPSRVVIDPGVLAALVPPPAARDFPPLWSEEGAH